MVEIFDEEMKEEVKDESKCDNDDGSCSGGLSVPSFSPPDLPDPGDRKDGEKEISPGWRKRLDASAVIQSLWIA